MAAMSANLLALSKESGYPLVQENGQRKFGPPPDWTGPRPQKGCELFIGGIPRDCFEDELIPLFQPIGKIYEFRLMLDFSHFNRGFGFVTYTNLADANKAVNLLHRYEVRPGYNIGVVISTDNNQLYIGKIPFEVTTEEIRERIREVADDVVNVAIPLWSNHHRGYAFVVFVDHKAAAKSRRKLITELKWKVHWAKPHTQRNQQQRQLVNCLHSWTQMHTQSFGSDSNRNLIKGLPCEDNEIVYVHYVEPPTAKQEQLHSQQH